MAVRRSQSWRWALDPRDPDYDDPPEALGDDECDGEPTESLPDTSSRYDPRVDGPYHYVPPGEKNG